MPEASSCYDARHAGVVPATSFTPAIRLSLRVQHCSLGRPVSSCKASSYIHTSSQSKFAFSELQVEAGTSPVVLTALSAKKTGAHAASHLHHPAGAADYLKKLCAAY